MAKARTKPAEGQGVIGEPTRVPQNVGELTAAPDRDRIAERAYQLYEARGGGEGRDMDDWLQAERELQTQGRRVPDER